MTPREEELLKLLYRRDGDYLRAVRTAGQLADKLAAAEAENKKLREQLRGMT